MYATTTALAAITTAFTDEGTLVAYSLGVIVAALVSLIGLGFALRKMQKRITGRKF